MLLNQKVQILDKSSQKLSKKMPVASWKALDKIVLHSL